MDIDSAKSREINSLQESNRALKSRHNALAPISRLPPETLAAIFSFYSSSRWNEGAGHLKWIVVAHVCRRWRETALNYPRLWSHINFTKHTLACATELLVRAKMAPLQLEVDAIHWEDEQLDVFGRQLKAHISHTRRLSIGGPFETILERLVSSAPTLESLSLFQPFDDCFFGQGVIPINLFNCTAPNLTSLELKNCDISWKSPLFKGLRTLKIDNLSTAAKPKLEDWLDVLNEMVQLETLILESATPLSPPVPLIPKLSRTVTLSSLTKFHISASANDCVFALAHLVLPGLTSLHVDAKSHEFEGGNVQRLIPYVTRNVYVLQGTGLLRSILISGNKARAEVHAWTVPDADVTSYEQRVLLRASVPATLSLTATCSSWHPGVNTAIFDALFSQLPVNSISTLTAQNDASAGLSKEFWINHAPKWPLLERASLVPGTVRYFREMLDEGAPSDGPRFPLLTKLVIVRVKLTLWVGYHIQRMLLQRVEQGVPLKVLDLRTCVVHSRAKHYFKEIVADVQEPFARWTPTEESTSIRHLNTQDHWYPCWYYDELDEAEDSDEELEYVSFDDNGWDDDMSYDEEYWTNWDTNW